MSIDPNHPDDPRDPRDDPAAPAEEAVPQVGRLGTTNTVTGASAPQAPPPLAEVPGQTPAAPAARPSKPRASERTRLLAKTGSLHLVLTALGLVLFLPFLYMFLTSVKDLSQVGFPSWIPGQVVTTDAGQFGEGEERLDELHRVIQQPPPPPSTGCPPASAS